MSMGQSKEQVDEYIAALKREEEATTAKVEGAKVNGDTVREQKEADRLVQIAEQIKLAQASKKDLPAKLPTHADDE